MSAGAGSTVAIGTFPEEEQVKRIAAAPAAGRVRYEPGLLPVPRYPGEPLPPGDPLGELDNVLVAPHSASTVATENATITDLFLDNLARLAAGDPLRNRYDPARGY